jgi:hypothetical protein
MKAKLIKRVTEGNEEASSTKDRREKDRSTQLQAKSVLAEIAKQAQTILNRNPAEVQDNAREGFNNLFTRRS